MSKGVAGDVGEGLILVLKAVNRKSRSKGRTFLSRMAYSCCSSAMYTPVDTVSISLQDWRLFLAQSEQLILSQSTR